MKVLLSMDISGFGFYENFGGYSWKKLKTNEYLHFFWEIFCETLDST